MNKNALIGGVVAVAIAAGAGFFLMKKKQHDELVQKIERKSNLVIGLTNNPQTLNPVLASSDSAKNIGDLVFDGLTNLSGERIDDFQLGAASELMQDGENLNVYEVILDTRKTWQDDPNHKLSSQDVRFTYEAIINPKNESPLRGRISKLIDHIKVIDASSFQIHFKEAIAPARVGWVIPFKIIPATYFGKAMSTDLKNDPVAQAFNRKPIGTGSFKVESWQGNQIKLSNQAVDPIDLEKATAQTLAQINKVHQVTFQQVHDRTKQAKMLMDGQLDLVLNSDPDLHAKLDGAGLKHSDYVPHYFYALAMNNQKAPFDQSKVRRSVSMSINKAEVAKTVWNQNPEDFVNIGPFPHNSERQYNSFKELNSYSPKLAKKGLASLQGSAVTLIYPEEASNMMERFAGKITQQLGDSGLKVQTKALGRAFDTQLSGGNYDLALVKHTGFTQGYDISGLFLSNSSQNITGYRNKAMDDILKKWVNTAFWTEKLPLSKQIHQRISVDAPYTFLFTLPTRAYYSARLDQVIMNDPSALLKTVSQWNVTR